jgi:hypothetical protein
MDPSAPHLKPWPRGHYLAVLFGILLALLSWLGAAVWTLLHFRRTETPTLAGLVCVGVVLIVICLPLAIARRRGLARARGLNGSNEEALAELRAGRYEEAAALLNALVLSARYAPAMHALYLHNLGMAWLHLGHLGAARTLMERALASGWLSVPVLRHVLPAVHVGRALALGLEGDLAGARAVLDALAPTLPEARKPMTMLAGAVIAVRGGGSVRFDEEALHRAEASLMPSHIRALRLLEAFSRGRPERSAYREGAGSDPVDAIGIHPGELDFLGAAWPELRAFLNARGLVTGESAG